LAGEAYMGNPGLKGLGDNSAPVRENVFNKNLRLRKDAGRVVWREPK
jgi:hypothetical protein